MYETLIALIAIYKLQIWCIVAQVENGCAEGSFMIYRRQNMLILSQCKYHHRMQYEQIMVHIYMRHNVGIFL